MEWEYMPHYVYEQKYWCPCNTHSLLTVGFVFPSIRVNSSCCQQFIVVSTSGCKSAGIEKQCLTTSWFIASSLVTVQHWQNAPPVPVALAAKLLSIWESSNFARHLYT